MTQTAQIEAHLKSGKPITPIEALNQYGCFRLGARILELRQKGLNIETDRDPKKHYAIYRLAA